MRDCTEIGLSVFAAEAEVAMTVEALIGAFIPASEEVVIDPDILKLNPGMEARCKSMNSYKICTNEVSLHFRHEEMRQMAKGTRRSPKIVRLLSPMTEGW